LVTDAFGFVVLTSIWD